MEKATLAALEASIAHWEENAKITDLAEAKLGIADCALCGLFFSSSDFICCSCPVFIRTGQRSCQGTPYYAALDANQEESLPAFIAAAEAELAFLKSLLPEENPQ